MNVDTGFQLDLLGALRRRGMLIATLTGATTLLGFWIAMSLPNQYVAYATLLVEPQAVSGRLVTPGVGETDLNERLHLMAAEILSRPRLSKVIDELGLYSEESESMSRQEVVDLMRQQVAVVPVLPELEAGIRSGRDLEINTFRVEFTAGSRVIAAEVAQHLANDFINEHVEARIATTAKSLDFIAAEQQRLAAEIARVEDGIAQVKDNHPGSLPEDLNATQGLISQQVHALSLAQRELDVSRSDEAFWESQATDALITGGSTDLTPGRRLQQLDLTLDALRARGFTEKHPDIIVTLQEIAEVGESMKAEGTAAEEGAPTNLAQRSALAQQARAGIRVKNRAAEIARLEKQLNLLRVQVEATPRVAEQLDSLERQHRQLNENLRDYNNRRLEAEVQTNLERRQLGEQFRVIEPAFPPSTWSSPNRQVIIVAAFLIGFSLGVAAAVVSETSDSSLHASPELQREFGVPVLASIPNILLAPDVALKRRRLIRRLAVATGVTVISLAGGTATYFNVNGVSGPAVDAEEDEEGRERALDLLREPGTIRDGEGTNRETSDQGA